MPAHIAQHDGGGIEVTQRAQPRFAVHLFCVGEDVGSQGIEQFNRVVERRGLEGLEQGRERGGAPRLVQRRQVGWFGRARTACQPLEGSRRQVGRSRQAQAVASNGIDALQMPQQLRRRAPLRRSAEILQSCERLIVIGGNQGDQLLMLFDGQGLGQALPQSQGRAMAHAADQAFQRGNAGEQHLVRQQPCGRAIEQQSGPVVPGPTQHVEPSDQPEAGTRVLLQVAEAVVIADGRGVTPALPPITVGLQARRRALAQLTRHGRNDDKRCLSRIVKKGAEEASRPKLDGKAEAIMGASHSADQLAIGGVEVEVAGELLLIGIAGVAAVTGALLVGHETARHGVRNSGLLRQSGRGPKIRHLHAAKVLCGIEQLCDKFRTTAERLA